MKIGFIGQGFLGKNYADDFEARGFDIVRYSPNQYPENLPLLKECEYIIIGVPTPTKDREFVGAILREAVALTSPGHKIIIKSTIKVGFTDMLQDDYPDRYFFHSAEFLTEANAANDVKNPSRNVIGTTRISDQFGEEAIDLFPLSTTNMVVTAKESEMGKYMSNFLLTTKVIMCNLVWDMCINQGIDYEAVRQIAAADPRIGDAHTKVFHEDGRGANGHCFPKDLSTVHEMYKETGNTLGDSLLEFIELYNIHVNKDSGKQLDILREVYGKMFYS